MLAAVVMVQGAACSALDSRFEDEPRTEDEGEFIEAVRSALEAGDPVSQAVAEGSCSTASVHGLSEQLVAEIQCLRPGQMKRIDGLPGIALGDGVSPWLQTPAADALIAAQRARGATIRINSALRALPAQYVLYRWYRQGKCGITLAASPGQSNHESGLAIDINDSAAWRPALQSEGFRWLGPSDVPHYDFRGDGTVNLAGLSVLAFQRLWNRNHPEDRIDEDSAYGPQTAARLERAPVGGFATGASTVCPPGADDDADIPTDAGAPSSDGAPEPDTDDELPSPSEGCAISGRAPSSHFGAVLFAVAAAAMLRRRRARRSTAA